MHMHTARPLGTKLTELVPPGSARLPNREGHHYFRSPPSRLLDGESLALLTDIAKRQQVASCPMQMSRTPLSPQQPVGWQRSPRRKHVHIIQEIRLSPVPTRHWRHTKPYDSHACPCLVEQRLETIKRRMQDTADQKANGRLNKLATVIQKLASQGASINDAIQAKAEHMLDKNGGHVGRAVKACKQSITTMEREATPQELETDQDESSPAASARFILAAPLDPSFSPYLQRQKLLRGRLNARWPTAGGAADIGVEDPIRDVLFPRLTRHERIMCTL
mmetsp:Transcript_45377/g.119123  ORF Transcript_45377/g.119123 Transcript_45377/m.119123 type:complete len:277 (+) Transcript_45377:14-844(+)